MGLDGIAGRALGQRLTGMRRKESDRAAANCNRPVEVARALGGKEPSARGKDGDLPRPLDGYSRRQFE